MLDILVKVLDLSNISHLRMDGGTAVRERQALCDAFNANAAPVFLLSTRACGIGLNLTQVRTCTNKGKHGYSIRS